MATLRSNRIKKQLFEDDMGDVMKTDVVAPQVGPFNFRPFPHLVIQQSNVDEEAEVNNNFVGSLLHPDVYGNVPNSVDSYFNHDFNMHNDEKRLKFEPCIEQ
ncbi:unnamed protein product [Prunus armeniaca]|uniref:Uncharacterized protein n=1 Tax=Prunus armeniaca TaxID=36596 RepID=A0A6J5WT05_PRUAR|nr:unnamed protein product [Prunus armeniaca]